MTGLPRSIIKKYGVTKKAWAVFRAGHSRSQSHSTRRSRSVAKKHRKYSGRSARGKLGGLISMKNLIGTLGGAVVARYAGMSPRLGAAAGAYFYGKTGILGAGVGYFVAPMATGIIDKTIGPQLTSLGFGTSPYGT